MDFIYSIISIKAFFQDLMALICLFSFQIYWFIFCIVSQLFYTAKGFVVLKLSFFYLYRFEEEDCRFCRNVTYEGINKTI